MTNEELLEAIGEIDPDFLARGKNGTARRMFSWTRFAAVFAAVMVMLTGTFTALACTSTVFNDILYQIWPWAAQTIRPVHLSCEDQGIRLEVQSVAVDEDRVMIAFTMRDLIGNRIDETTEVVPPLLGSSASCSMISFDQETKTAAFLAEEVVHGFVEKLTLHFTNFRSGNKSLQVDITDMVDWKKAAEPVQGMKQENVIADSKGIGGTYGVWQEWMAQYYMPDVLSAVPVLPHHREHLDIQIVQGKAIEDYGLIDGFFHIRFRSDDADPYDLDDSVSAIMTDGKGNRITDGHTVSTGKEGEETTVHSLKWHNNHQLFEEYMFDVRSLDLYELHLEVLIFSSGLKMEGNWIVTVPMDLQEI